MASHAPPGRKPADKRKAERAPARRAVPQSPRGPAAATQLAAIPTPRGAAIRRLEGAGPPSPNRTGLPDGLKAGLEAQSGLAMDDVRVHRNSAEPSKLGALAYARGSDIHLGPGQEHHLPHEAWHVVQQKQGRVKPTVQREGFPINDERSLEGEAEARGRTAERGYAADPHPLPWDGPAPRLNGGRIHPGSVKVAQLGAGPSRPAGAGTYRRALGGAEREVRIDDDGEGELRVVDVAPRAEGPMLQGYVHYEQDERVMQLKTILSDPPRSGLGHLLMRQLARVARRRQCTSILILTPAPDAVPYYEQYGAQPADPARHSYWTGMVGEDELGKLTGPAEDRAEAEAGADRTAEEIALTRTQARADAATPGVVAAAQEAARRRAFALSGGMVIGSAGIAAIADAAPAPWN